MKEIKIYVGLNDADLHTQKFETPKYMKVLKSVCKNYGVGFSIEQINGGYFHEDGTYVEENTLVLTLIDIPKETVKEIAKDLCIFFNQESVLITKDEIETFFFSERLDKNV